MLLNASFLSFMNDLLLNWRTHDEVVIQTAERCREYTPTDVCVFMSVTHMLADWGKPGGQGGFCHQILSLLLPLLLLTSFTLHGTSEEFHSNPNFKFLESLEGGRGRRREVGEEGGGGGRGRRGGGRRWVSCQVLQDCTQRWNVTKFWRSFTLPLFSVT